MTAPVSGPALLDAPTTGPAPAGPVVGVDVLSPTLKAVDAVAATLVGALRVAGLADRAVVATHATRLGAVPHLTLSVEVPGADGHAALVALVAAALPGAEVGLPGQDGPAAAGAARHAERRSGRCVHFPGVELLVGTLTVGDLLAGSAIELVRVLGAPGPVDPSTPLLTRDHVRPLYEGGRLVLPTDPAVGGALVPFEVPDPKPCCVDHG